MIGKVYGEISVQDYLQARRHRHGGSTSSRRARVILLVVSMTLVGYVAGGLLPFGTLGTAVRAASEDKSTHDDDQR